MQNNSVRVLFIGDVFGNAGRRALAENLRRLLDENRIDLCVANGENVAGGRGITLPLLKKMHKYGVQVVTGGNHSLGNAESRSAHESDGTLLRPLNLPPGNIGIGKIVLHLPGGIKAGVINLQGRTFFNDLLDCPFRSGSDAVKEIRRETPVIIIDFHAEASSEKMAFANYLDGQVSAVIGTHTHVQTADERILPQGTAYITDAGMTGPEDSIIGMRKRQVTQKFLLQTYERFEPSLSCPMINAVVLEIDSDTGTARSIRRIYNRVKFQ